MTTPRQADLLAFLRYRALLGEVCPSFEEMRCGIGAGSKAQVWRLLELLEAEGKIVRRHKSNRSIDIVGFTEYEKGYRDGVAAERRRMA